MNEWYYRDSKNRKVGPLSDEEFEQCVTDGEIHARTRVWRSGLADWTTYEALLAHDASCAAVATGPTESVAPHSSSYCTQVALGASATSRPPNGACTATPSATPHSLLAPAFEKCPGCGEEVPSHLVREFGQRRSCGFCVQKQEAKARRDKLRDAKGVDSNWIGKFLLRCALIAGVFVLGRVVLFELRHVSDSPSLLPTIEAPSAFPALASAPREVPATAKPATTVADLSLPPDIELIPPAAR
jgi:hypothetical protein